jgi:hypothetical protein
LPKTLEDVIAAAEAAVIDEDKPAQTPAPEAPAQAAAPEPDEEDEEDEEDGEEEPEEAAPELDAKAVREAVRAALEKGDLDAVAEAVGAEGAKFDKAARKWAKQQAKIHALETKLSQAEAQGASISKIKGIVEQINQGRFEATFELIRELTGQDPDGLVIKAIRSRAVADPRVEALEAERRKLAEELERAKSVPLDAAEKAFLEIIKDEVPSDHEVRQLPGWAKKVAKLVKASVDPDTGEAALSARQAAARVLRKEKEAFEARAKVFGKGERPPAKPTPPLERQGSTAPAPGRKLTEAEFFARFS